MTIKVSVRGRFVYNGKVYGSLEEMPENVQETYRKALAGSVSGAPDGTPGAKVKVVFNGTEYESVDAMPPEARRLYEDAIGAVESGRLPGVGASPGPPASPAGESARSQAITAAPIEPGAPGERRAPVALAIGLVVLVMLLGFYLYHSGVAR